MSRDDAQTSVTFVVRVSRDDTGSVRGSVTRVRTGEATSFTGIEEAACVLTEMLRRELGGEPARPALTDRRET